MRRCLTLTIDPVCEIANSIGTEANEAAQEAQIAEWAQAGKPRSIVTSRKAWQSVSSRGGQHKRRGYGIDVDLHDILEVDVARLLPSP